MVMIISIGFWQMVSSQAATQLNKFGWGTVVFEIVSQNVSFESCCSQYLKALRKLDNSKLGSTQQ